MAISEIMDRRSHRIQVSLLAIVGLFLITSSSPLETLCEHQLPVNDTPCFMIYPYNYTVNLCDNTTEEQLTVFFHCAAYHAIRIKWVIKVNGSFNRTITDSHDKRYNATYSTVPHVISNDHDQVITVRCEAYDYDLQRGQVLQKEANITVNRCDNNCSIAMQKGSNTSHNSINATCNEDGSRLDALTTCTVLGVIFIIALVIVAVLVLLIVILCRWKKKRVSFDGGDPSSDLDSASQTYHSSHEGHGETEKSGPLDIIEESRGRCVADSDLNTSQRRIATDGESSSYEAEDTTIAKGATSTHKLRRRRKK